jgi:hypothetical protein
MIVITQNYQQPSVYLAHNIFNGNAFGLWEAALVVGVISLAAVWLLGVFVMI